MTKHKAKKLVKEIGKQFRYSRKYHSLTQGKIAKLSGLSVSMISQIEKGRILPSAMSIYRIADALKLKISII